MAHPAFISAGDTVLWLTGGGFAALRPEDVSALLDIFMREGCRSLWLELDEAAQGAGYPAALSSMRGAA